MVMRRVLGWMAVMAALLLPSRGAAFRTLADDDPTLGPRVTWASPNIAIAVYERPPRDVLLVDLHRVLRLAGSAWTDPTCSALRIPTLTTTARHAAPGDGIVVVEALQSGWRERGLSGDVGATTDLVFELVEADGTWRVVDADVLINDVDYSWSAASQPLDGPHRDLRSVLTHEMGHSLASLAHPCAHGVPGIPDCSAAEWFATTMMNPDYRGAEYALSADDVLGACTTYPLESCAGVRCAMGTACIDGGTCAMQCGSTVCAADQECMGGLCVTVDSCESETCEPRPGCVETPTQSCGAGAPGDACTVDEDCATDLCDAGTCRLGCTADGSCPAPYECRGGSCEPPAGVFGDPCSRARECTTALCLREGEASTCTRSCGRDADCPDDHLCGEVSGHAVCRQGPTGCSVGHAASSGPAGWAVVTMWLLGLGWRRRRA